MLERHFDTTAPNLLEVDMNALRALSDERFLAPGGQAAFAMSHERFGR